jgi:hypothetical protein
VHHARVAQPAYLFNTGFDYGGLVYSRTASVLETMRRTYGSVAFDKAMELYAYRYRFQHPTPEDFVGTLEEVLGPDARQILKIALFDKGWVDYDIRTLRNAPAVEPAGLFDRGGQRETLTPKADPTKFEGWVLVGHDGPLAFPVEVELTFADGSVKRTSWDGLGDSFRVPFNSTSPLVSAVVDPEERVLIDMNRQNNHRSLTSKAPMRTAERLFYWAQLFLQWIAP